jgi:hypothetical protein
MEICEVTFDETQPCNSSVFECAADDEVGKKIFEDEEDDAKEDDGDDGEVPATHVVGYTPRVLMQGRRKSRRQIPTRIPLYSY